MIVYHTRKYLLSSHGKRNYNGDEFEAGDCGKGYNFTKGTADGILCSELEVIGVR